MYVALKVSKVKIKSLQFKGQYFKRHYKYIIE